MARVNRLVGAIVVAGSLVGVGAPMAAAAPPANFTITENIDFTSEVLPTFTTTGALCPSGTFEDTVESVGGHPDTTGSLNLLISTVYTCDDGSGSFYARKHVLIAFNDDGSSTNSGPITFHGGTGDYTRLSGHGVDIGTASADGIGLGEISGVLSRR